MLGRVRKLPRRAFGRVELYKTKTPRHGINDLREVSAEQAEDSECLRPRRLPAPGSLRF
ncbi:hypothetical protein SBA4_2280003 [Candidatus Sulfopaludibacter sp. SbA4]|nr:hypothetical protein SBA4_2280003 [Candidatus Sulfopaludibacter sp. SbA4]